MFDDTRPIFLQLADRIADEVLRGVYAAGEQVPSTNELAAHLRINPATAGKALGLLVEQGVLEKRRGIGMFVAPGAREQIQAERQRDFTERFIDPLLTEARSLGLTTDELIRIISEKGEPTS
ncbi:GntR family transcriptional regulator [Leucobacter sp. PH1c]|uniref:GntR family transcriptional regulator n=1 Tax=Leucobacter sp. PH1c TaxID=1397278 RepID=UPI00046A87D7|nr:GntR family transcriptional regulator [Leucobacter sp. PH1c]